MKCVRGGMLILLITVSASYGNGPGNPATPAEQYQALLKEFTDNARGLYLARSDEDRKQIAERGATLPRRFLELAETNPSDPIALDALTQALNTELWLENNTLHPGFGSESREARALAILIRDYVQSDRIAETTRRAQYGFRKECETFLRAVLEKNSNREIQGLTCLRLAQCLTGRLQKLDLLKERPQMARRYEGLFGKGYVKTLQRQDRSSALAEIESIFRRAAEEYGDVSLPYGGGTVGEKAKSELHELRFLTVGREAQEIEGEDQEGRSFRLSDYRGKVVLLYFWSEY